MLVGEVVMTVIVRDWLALRESSVRFRCLRCLHFLLLFHPRIEIDFFLVLQHFVAPTC